MISAEQLNSLPHGVEESSSDGLTQACSPGACRAPPTEQKSLRPLQASELVHLHFHFILWAKASHQIRFEEQRNRPLVVMGEDAVTLQRKGGELYPYLHSVNHIIYCRNQRRESWGLRVGTGARGEAVVRKSWFSIRNASRKLSQYDINRKE